MAKINSINNQSGSLTVDPGASGDSFVQFDINATGEFRIGVDDDAADAFKISQGSALGTNDTFVMTAAGENTKPLQPAFSARLASTLNNVTGDATVYTVVYDTEVFDQNADFNGTTTFTAPVTGRYELMFSAKVEGLTSSHTSGEWIIVTSNRSYSMVINPYAARATFGGAAEYTNVVYVLADMDASDTATTTITVSGGTKVVDLTGSSVIYCGFSGALIC